MFTTPKGWGKIGLRGGGGRVVRAPFLDPPPLLGSRDGDARRADRGGWGGGVLSTTTHMTQNDPPRCTDHHHHFEVCIMREIFLENKTFRAALQRRW